MSGEGIIPAAPVGTGVTAADLAADQPSPFTPEQDAYIRNIGEGVISAAPLASEQRAQLIDVIAEANAQPGVLEVSSPFTPEQEARIREIIVEQLVPLSGTLLGRTIMRMLTEAQRRHTL